MFHNLYKTLYKVTINRCLMSYLIISQSLWELEQKERRLDIGWESLARQIVDKLGQTVLSELGREILQLGGELENAVQDQTGSSNASFILYKQIIDNYRSLKHIFYSILFTWRYFLSTSSACSKISSMLS